VLSIGLVDASSGRSATRLSFRHLRGRHALAVLYAAGALGVAFGAFATFSQPMVLEMGGQQVRGLFIGYTAAAVAARLLLGTLADSLGRTRVSLVALALYGAVVLAMAALRPDTLVLFGIGVGLAHGLAYPALTAVLIGRIGPAGRGSAMAFFVGAFNAGGAISCLGLGVMASAWGYPSVFLTAGFTALSAVVGLAGFAGGKAALHGEASLNDKVLR
jgi:MFS family permease